MQNMSYQKDGETNGDKRDSEPNLFACKYIFYGLYS